MRVNVLAEGGWRWAVRVRVCWLEVGSEGEGVLAGGGQ